MGNSKNFKFQQNLVEPKNWQIDIQLQHLQTLQENWIEPPLGFYFYMWDVKLQGKNYSETDPLCLHCVNKFHFSNWILLKMGENLSIMSTSCLNGLQKSALTG